MELCKFYEYVNQGKRTFYIGNNSYVPPQIVKFAGEDVDETDDMPQFFCTETDILVFLKVEDIESYVDEASQSVKKEVASESPTRVKGTWSYSCSKSRMNGETIYKYYMKCSNCGKSELRLSSKFEYCPHCGAEME